MALEQAQVNSALELLKAKCGWAVSYLANLQQTGYFGDGFDSGGSFLGHGEADGLSYGDEHTSPSYSPGSGFGLYAPVPDWGARIHISGYAFWGNSMQLTMTLAHEAAHGYFNAPDYETPDVQVGEAEWYAQQCFAP